MKGMRSKRPTRAQKIIIKRWHLNPENWLVKKETPYEMTIVHKHTEAIRIIPEGNKGKKEFQEAI
jgi:hypothetical protein